MKDFYEDFGFVIAFMAMTLFFNMAFDEKATRYFLLIVLAGMVILNAGTVSNWLSEKFTLKEGEEV